MSTGPRLFSDTDKKAQDPLTRKHQTNQKNPVSTSTISSLNAVKSSLKRPLENDTNGTNLEPNSTTTSQSKSQLVEVKRQKVTNEGLNQNVATVGLKKYPCAFCHSSKTTEGSGPLVAYSQGHEVERSSANFPKATHVHSKCIEWTPRIYFKDEKIQNLEAELKRANKLNCSKCGKKGAGLGCYMKTCQRTYHVPCAYNTPGCRWDGNDTSYLILCPMHAKMKFPSEVDSDNVKKDSEKIIPTQLNPCTTKKLVFCGSDLSTEEKCLLVDFASNNEAVVSKYWRDNVTHVITTIDSNLACIRTYKVLMAILNGKWVVTVEWVKACVKSGSLVKEEPYEVQLDSHGCTGGPKSGRLRILNNGPSLFKKLKFYFVGDFVQDFKDDLVRFVTSGGGKIIETKDELLSNDEDVKGVSLVVYNADVADHSEFDDEDSIKDQRLATAEDIAQESRSHVIPHIWILESIAACRVLPFT